jgi:oxysterol-binding protein-related protein 8
MTRYCFHNMEETTLDEGNKSIILGIIDQLRKGTDLHRVSLPTFVLEPRSMCERLLDFFSFQDILRQADSIEDPAERILQVCRYFFSGWHFRPKGVKKPFNPILGEFHRCYWKENDGTDSFYVCEQVSHHPPVSAFLYSNPANGILVEGELSPKAKFLGNSAATIMDGGSEIFMRNDSFLITNPNVYARSILFGSMYMELGDTCKITSQKYDVTCTIEFKQQGFFRGEKDIVQGHVFHDGQEMYKIKGKWSEKTVAVDQYGKEHLIFDKPSLPVPQRIISPEAEQEDFESKKYISLMRLWAKVAQSVRVNDHGMATKEKSKIEDNQRLLVKGRSEHKKDWRPRFFECVDGKWRSAISSTYYEVT